MEANIAYYCLHKLHRWPHEFLDLEVQEQAYVVAAVQMKMEQERKEGKKMKKPRKR
ncbi:hypothetical protein [Clostridium sp. AN503]|uniref:hypothetical protein n=1 Tax=Clostridium sp. AN503 TaxID=3160598 RepID=UPI00345A137D